MRAKWFLVGLLSLVVACGQDDPSDWAALAEAFGTQNIDSDLASLLPADTHIVVLARSIQNIDNITGLIGAMFQEDVEYKSRMGLVGIDAKVIDPNRPLAVAFRLEKIGSMPRPVATVILPVADPAAVAKSAHPMFKSKEVGGSYVALSQDPNYAAGSSKLVSGMPAGDVVIRVDLGAAVELFRSDIDGVLGLGEMMVGGNLGKMAPGVDATSAAKGAFGYIRDFILSAEYLDIVAHDASPMLSADMIYTAKPGSKIAEMPGGETNLREMAKHLGANTPLAILFKMDAQALAQYSEAASALAQKQMSPEQARVMDEVNKKLMKFAKNMGHDWGASVNVASSGLHLAVAARATDAGDVAKQYSEVFGSLTKAGVTYAPGDKMDVGGATAYPGQLTFSEELKQSERSLERLFPNGVNLTAAGGNGRLSIVMSSDGVGPIKELVKGAEPSQHFAHALSEAKGTLGFLVHLEARGFLKGATEFARARGDKKAPTVKDGDAVPGMIFGTRNGRALRIGFRLDAKAMTNLVKEVDEAGRARRGR